tara:strand:+ start:777 stop:956 length:180 start_codon:yes stop_codon:yes gene_type:complete
LLSLTLNNNFKKEKIMKNRATWELKNMVKALSMLELLNTEEENKRLQEAKQELKCRGKL